jgi:SAM-dependent methyltransferase
MTEQAGGRLPDGAGGSSARRPRPGDARTESAAGMPSVARIHNILLGGQGHDPADRDAAGELLRLAPYAVAAAYQNRRFLESAVLSVAGAGVRQFLDVGCGLLGPGAVHETAARTVRGPRVVYVDHDPSVIAQLNASLADYPTALAVYGDVRFPASLLRHPALRSLIDISEPVAIILTSVLHYVADDDDPGGIVTDFKQAMAPGSRLILSHVTGDYADAAFIEGVRRIFEAAGSSFVPRRHAEISGFFDGLEIVPPGVVSGANWRPGYLATDPRRTTFYAGLAIKR